MLFPIQQPIANSKEEVAVKTESIVSEQQMTYPRKYWRKNKADAQDTSATSN
jgi:hypothetical protein